MEQRRIKIKIFPPPVGGRVSPRRKLKTVSKHSNEDTTTDVNTGTATGSTENSDGNVESSSGNDCVKVELDQDLDQHDEDNAEEQDYFAELNNQVSADVEVEHLKESKVTSHGQRTGRDGEIFKCILCPKSFDKELNLNNHKKNFHKITWKATDEEIIASTCGECGKVFRQPSRFLDHLPTHLSMRPEECQICSKTYKRKKNLKEHLKKVHKI